jgi:xanthine dehydrogenase YagS FAD-binding subunit
VAPTPRRVREAEAVLEANQPGETIAAEAAGVALSGASPLQHNAFKLDLARALIMRGIIRLAAG